MSVQKYWYLLGLWDTPLGRYASPEKALLWDNTKGAVTQRTTIEEEAKALWHNGGSAHFYNTARDYFGKRSRHPDYLDQCPYSYFDTNAVAVAIDPRGTTFSEKVFTESETADGFPARWYEGESIVTPMPFFDVANPGPGVTPAVGKLKFYRNTGKNLPSTGSTVGLDISVGTLAVKLPEYMAGHTSGFFYSGTVTGTERYTSRYARQAEWAYAHRYQRAVSIRVGSVVALEDIAGDQQLVYVDVHPSTKIPWGGIEGVTPTLSEVIEARGDGDVFYTLSDFPRVGTSAQSERGDGIFDFLLKVVRHTDSQVVFLMDTSVRKLLTMSSEVYLNIIYDTLIEKFRDDILRPDLLYNDAPRCCYVNSQIVVSSFPDGPEYPETTPCYQLDYKDPHVDDYPFDDDIDLRKPYTGLSGGNFDGAVFYTDGIKIIHNYTDFRGTLKEDYYTEEPPILELTALMSIPAAVYELLRDSTFSPEAYVNDDRYVSLRYSADGLHRIALGYIRPTALVGDDAIYFHHNQDVFLSESINKDNLIFRLVPRDMAGNRVSILKPVAEDDYLNGSGVVSTVACEDKLVRFNVHWHPMYEIPYPFEPEYIANDDFTIYSGFKSATAGNYSYNPVQTNSTGFDGAYTFLGPTLNNSGFAPYRLTDGGIIGGMPFLAAAYEDSIKVHFSVFLNGPSGFGVFDSIRTYSTDNYESDGPIRTVVAGFSNGEHFNYVRPTKAYYRGFTDGKWKITQTTIPSSNGTVNHRIGSILPAGDVIMPDIVVHSNGDESWGDGTYSTPYEHAVLGAYWESSLTKLRYMIDFVLPRSAGYLLNGYRGLYLQSDDTSSFQLVENNPLFRTTNMTTPMSLCLIGDTHPLVHLGGDITEAVSLNGLGEITLGGNTGARYTATGAGIDVVAMKDDYNEVVVYILIYNMPKYIVFLMSNEVDDTINYTPRDVYVSQGQTSSQHINSLHSNRRGSNRRLSYGGNDYRISLEPGAMVIANGLADFSYRTFPVNGFFNTTNTTDWPADYVIVGDGFNNAGEFVDNNSIVTEHFRLSVVQCVLDQTQYAVSRKIYVNIEGPAADNIEVMVGYLTTDSVSLSAQPLLDAGATEQSVSRIESGYVIDLSRSLYGIPLGGAIVVAVYDRLVDKLETWMDVAKALPALDAPVSVDFPATGISDSTINSGETGPTLL